MSTWMPLGIRIICCAYIKYCKSINYINIAKIDLFTVLQNYPLVH